VGSIVEDYRAIQKRRKRFSFFRDKEGNLDLPKVMDSLVACGLFGWLTYDTFGAISYAQRPKTPLGRSKALNSIGKRSCALDLVKNLTDSLDDPDSTCLVERDPNSPFSCLVMILQHIAGTETANAILLTAFSLLAIYTTGSENAEPNYYLIYSCLANLLVDLVETLKTYRNKNTYDYVDVNDEEYIGTSEEESNEEDSSKSSIKEVLKEDMKEILPPTDLTFPFTSLNGTKVKSGTPIITDNKNGSLTIASILAYYIHGNPQRAFDTLSVPQKAFVTRLSGQLQSGITGTNPKIKEIETILWNELPSYPGLTGLEKENKVHQSVIHAMAQSLKACPVTFTKRRQESLELEKESESESSLGKLKV
jgi:hypothetical protein